MKRLIALWKAKSPVWAKWLTNLGVALLALGGSLMAINNFDELPQVYKDIAVNSLAIGTGLSALKLTKKKEENDSPQ